MLSTDVILAVLVLAQGWQIFTLRGLREDVRRVEDALSDRVQHLERRAMQDTPGTAPAKVARVGGSVASVVQRGTFIPGGPVNED